jgi:hypothetical protein
MLLGIGRNCLKEPESENLKSNREHMINTHATLNILIGHLGKKGNCNEDVKVINEISVFCLDICEEMHLLRQTFFVKSRRK